MGKTDCGISLGEATITDLDFADNIVIIAEMLGAFVGTMDSLSSESEPLGVPWINTKIQRFVASFDENIDLPHQLL